MRGCGRKEERDESERAKVRGSKEDEVPIRSFIAPFPRTKNSILYIAPTSQLWVPHSTHYDIFLKKKFVSDTSHICTITISHKVF